MNKLGNLKPGLVEILSLSDTKIINTICNTQLNSAMITEFDW